MSDTRSLPLFSLTINGTDVTCREVHRTRTVLCVQLVRPYGLIHSSLSMPSFMSMCGADLRGPLGDEKREKLLRSCYEHALFTEELLPALLRTLGQQPERAKAFAEAIESRLALAHADARYAPLPWNHPERFRHEVQWLRHNAALPDHVRLALPMDDAEMEWQLLLIVHHALAKRFVRMDRMGEWEGN